MYDRTREDFQTDIVTNLKSVIRFPTEDEEERFSMIDSSLLGRNALLSTVCDSLPQFGTKQQLEDNLRGSVTQFLNLSKYINFDNNPKEYSDYINEYIMKLEREFRRLTGSCICNNCTYQQREGEDYSFWCFHSISVSIDKDYEFHGRKIGVNKIPEFRVKYTSNELENCTRRSKSIELATLLNTMHCKLNSKFITVHEFLRPMDNIENEMNTTVYDEEEVLKNNYNLIRNFTQAELLDVALCFYDVINVSEYTTIKGFTPDEEVSIFNRQLHNHFCYTPGICFNRQITVSYVDFINSNRFLFKLCDDDIDMYTKLIQLRCEK
jgi:hypothetical protein